MPPHGRNTFRLSKATFVMLRQLNDRFPLAPNSKICSLSLELGMERLLAMPTLLPAELCRRMKDGRAA